MLVQKTHFITSLIYYRWPNFFEVFLIYFLFLKLQVTVMWWRRIATYISGRLVIRVLYIHYCKDFVCSAVWKYIVYMCMVYCSPTIYDLAFIKSNFNVFMLIFIFYLNARSYRKCQNIRSTFHCHFKSGADSQINPLHTPNHVIYTY